MKKIIGIIALVFIGLLTLGAVAGNDTDNTPTSGNDIEYTTTTTVDTNASERSFCAGKAYELGNLWTEYASILPYASTAADARAAIGAGRSLVDASNAWLSRCDQYFPIEATQIRVNLKSFEDVLDDLENVF